MDEKLIIDVGMHKGMDTEFYLKKGFDVVAVEANPALVDEVSTRLSDYIATGRLRIFNVAIHDYEGTTDFFVNEDKDDWSSIFERVGGRRNTSYRVEQVRCVPFNSILEEVGIPYYLKIDIEQADFIALKKLSMFEDRPRFLSCEGHSIDLFCEMRRLGYGQFKVVNQRRLGEVRCPNPPLEGDYVDVRFTGIHSGPFGEEAPGAWMDIENAVYQWLHKRMGFTERGELGEGWYDIHAKLLPRAQNAAEQSNDPGLSAR